MNVTPNCQYLVEGGACGHPQGKKLLWVFNTRCVYLKGKKECSIQKEFSENNESRPPNKIIKS